LLKRHDRFQWRLAITIVFVIFGVLLPAVQQPVTAKATQTDAGSLEQQLADKYSPIVYLRQQAYQCASPPDGGEPYLPLPVEIVLDNPEVLVRDRANNDHVVATGVNAAELATYGPDTYLDFPGDPRRPGCTYETHERFRIEELGLEPTVYARVIFDAENNRLALQYWFFYYFNDWNNTHEADWEGIVLFWDDVSGVDAALGKTPDRIALAQHGGGELADWGDDKDDKLAVEDDTHPVVYPAAGAHATFYGNKTYLGWGENGSGFGCDVSSPPSVRVPVKAVLIPDVIDPNGPFAWALYEGRWGERGPAMFNGVHGPNRNSRWADTWAATDNWRHYSLVVSGNGNTLGPTMTDAFCGLTAAGSRLLIHVFVNPWLALGAVALVIAVFVYFYRRTRVFIRGAFALYFRHWRLFTGIGLMALPIGIIFNLVYAFLVTHEPIEWLVDWFNNTAGARLPIVAAVGGAQQLVMFLIIGPAVIQAIVDLRRGDKPSVLRSYRMALRDITPLAGGALLFLLCAGIPLLLVFGLPLTIFLVIRWQFFGQAVMFGHAKTGRAALQDSANAVKGRWWKTLFAAAIFDLIAVLPGIVVGLALLMIGRTAVSFANGVSSFLFSLSIPISVIAMTLLYLDRYKEDEEAAEAAAGD
jgi:hypothetical protein